MLNWVKQLLSTSNTASVRRFIALQAFYCLIIILIVSLVNKQIVLANILIIKEIEYHFFIIVLAGYFSITTSNIVELLKPSNKNNEPLEQQ